MFDQPTDVELSEHLLLRAVKQFAQIQVSGIARSRHAARAYRVCISTRSTQTPTAFKGSAIQLVWRTHSCVPRRGSSRRLFRQPLKTGPERELTYFSFATIESGDFMSRVEKIENQIKELSPDELTALREWFADFDGDGVGSSDGS